MFARYTCCTRSNPLSVANAQTFEARWFLSLFAVCVRSILTMFLVLPDTGTAALQSSMRRWMTVPTTCIWIGFKVSYVTLKFWPFIWPRVPYYTYILPPTSSHGFRCPTPRYCISPFLCGFSPSTFLSLSLHSYPLSLSVSLHSYPLSTLI